MVQTNAGCARCLSVESTVQEWARRFVETASLEGKRQPGPAPQEWASDSSPIDLKPGRPIELRVTWELPQSAKLSALQAPEARARLMHQFWHHELQAAELMAWALLRFPETPLEFRRGLVRILEDEVRHMGLYEAHMQTLGARLGAYPVRDWIWGRVQECASPLEFVALLGMGFEGANLDHAARYAQRFRAVGDEPGARIQEQVGLEEVAHVRFATSWFREWTGGVEFSRWRAELPGDLRPLQVRGKQLSHRPRSAANMPDEFLAELAGWVEP